MAIITKEITLDAVRDNVGCTVPAKQNDVQSRFIKARITADRRQVRFDPHSTAVINALLPDGSSNGFVGKVEEDGTVTVPITSWMLSLCGTVKCDISVFDGTERLTTMPFYITVEESLYDGEGIENEPDYGVLSSLMAEAQEIRTAESLRVSAEMTRVETEEERAFSESQRENAEAVRETNEAARDTAEGLREIAETLREELEVKRAASETERTNGEALRESHESDRVLAEQRREEAEKARAVAEGQRTTFIPYVSSSGVISWTNDKGLVNPEPVSVKPVKGVDYLTDSDRDELVNAVLLALPRAEGSEF